MEELYLAFVDELGKDADGNYIYRMDFTEDKEIVWGDYFHIVPAIIIPDLQPDVNCLKKQGKFISKNRLELAKRNGCFSMQDCIDGIISLCFSEISEDTVYYKDEPLHFEFGELYDSVVEKLNACGLELYDVEEVKKGDDTAIDDLIDQLGKKNEDNEDPEDF